MGPTVITLLRNSVGGVLALGRLRRLEGQPPLPLPLAPQAAVAPRQQASSEAALPPSPMSLPRLGLGVLTCDHHQTISKIFAMPANDNISSKLSRMIRQIFARHILHQLLEGLPGLNRP